MRNVVCRQPTLHCKSLNTKVNRLITTINMEPAFVTAGIRQPNWLDTDGVMYGIGSSNLIARSTDLGRTWSNIPGMVYSGVPESVIITDTKRIVFWNGAGQTFISGENFTPPLTQVYQFNYGATGFTFGFYKYKNIIIQSAYGLKQLNGALSPRQVILSIDDGATWNLVFEDNQDPNTHIHDVTYDPWDQRIIISGGDDVRRIIYSDDFGQTWTYVYTSATATNLRTQPTYMVPMRDKIILGMDTSVNGLAIWHKPPGVYQAPIRETDIFLQYLTFDDCGNNMRVLANRGTYFDIGGERIILMPFASDTIRLGFSRILATKDGLTWYEIWRDSISGMGNEIQWLTGPFPGDPTRTVYGNYLSLNPTVSKLIKFRIPDIL